jgi:enterochelin esterase family protein
MDGLINSGEAVPMIIVMDCGDIKTNSDVRKASTNDVTQIYINDLMPFIEKTFRTKNDRQFRAMAGLSRGGFQTTTTVFNNLDKFAWMGTFSGFFMRPGQNVEDSFNGIFKDPAAFDKQMNLLFISTGTEERTPKEAVETLKAKGIKNIVYYESQGTAHEWLTWRRSLKEFAPRLFK